MGLNLAADTTLPPWRHAPKAGSPAYNWRGAEPSISVHSPELTALHEPLSARELEVLHLLADGYSNRRIAESLIIAVGTVKRHMSNIAGKIGAENRLAAVARARELGLL